MKLTRQQRINNIGSEMVNGIVRTATEFKNILKNGIDLPAGNPDGYPALKATGQEILEALGENGKAIETVIDFVLDGKSNKITKGAKKK